MQDAYYEEQMGGVIDDMLLQVHMLGGGYVNIHLSWFTVILNFPYPKKNHLFQIKIAN